MNSLATIVGLMSGFALMGFREPAATMLATSLLVDLSLAPLTAVIAYRRGRSAVVWTLMGVALGMWALAYVLIFKPRCRATPEFSPESDAA